MPVDTVVVEPMRRRFQELLRMSSVYGRLSASVCLCGVWLLASAGCQQTAGYVYNRSGQVNYQRGQYALARYEFSQAAMLNPSNPDYRHNLALAMMKTGDTAGAEHVLRENLSQVSAMHQPTYHTLSQMLIDQQRTGEAQQLLAGWTQTQPYVPEANVEMAWLQRQTGDLAGAEQSLRNALQVNPRQPHALAQLGQLYEDSGQPDRAAAMYQRSLATRWSQPQVQSRLQLVSSGRSQARVPTRSAMMMNPMMSQPTVVYGPSPTMSSASPTNWTATAQPTPMATLPMVTAPMESTPIMAAAPSLGPTPDPMVSGLPGPTVDPESGIAFEAPLMAGPVITPNADPAHAQPEMTAELPLVDPR